MTRVPERFDTARLHARRPNEGDLEYVIATDGDPAIQVWLGGSVQTREESRVRLKRWLEHWNERGFGFWIFNDDAGNDVGHAGIFPSPREPGTVEVGYALKPAFWGCGYATEMTLAVMRIAFEDAGLDYVAGISLASNGASRRVLEKSGLTYEREYPYADGRAGVLYSARRGHENV